MPGDLSSALRFFNAASEYISASGLQQELSWQRRVDFEQFTETQLLREAAWVILCSGFRESIVRRIFDHVSLSFCDWESAELIVKSKDLCRTAALASFRNERKLDALWRTAELVHLSGFSSFKAQVLQDPITQLQTLPYIGPITAVHLAKNLGLDVAKPDRHLVRLSRHFGYRCTNDLCCDIASVTGEQVKVIDLALWRYMADVRPALLT
jgi:hypothetical protein